MSTPSAEQTAAYEACFKEIIRQSPLLIERWCAALADVLHQKATLTPILIEKRQLREAVSTLKINQRALEKGFTLELSRAIAEDAKPGVTKKAEGGRTLSTISFDDLELMGEHQVQQTLEGARLEQTLSLCSEYELAGFSARLSTAQGYKQVQADKNPLRTEIVARVLLKSLSDLPADAATRTRWLNQGSLIMGKELQSLYVALTNLLATRGMAPALYSVISAPPDKNQKTSGSGDMGADAAGHVGASARAQALRHTADANADAPVASVSREQLLTLDRLHRLMAGDYDDSFKPEPVEPAVDSGFDFDNLPRNDFSHTVPAAMDVLAELQKKGLARPKEKGSRSAPPSSVALIREQLKTEAKSLGQSVAIEVVGLMIEQLTNDGRLLAPVKRLIANTEPAFLRLAVTDPRFFSDKTHPARQLLETITARSLAFSSEEAHGFAGFMLDLHTVAQALTEEDASDAQHFATLLADFEGKLARRSREADAVRQRALQALLHAEQRNMLAEKIATEIRQRPDFVAGNRTITGFLTGPWAHVMAKERLQNEADGAESARAVFSLTLGDLLWSMNLEQTMRHRKQLIRLIPEMLSSVRDGLLSIDFPLADSKPFYDELMKIHQQGLNATAAVSAHGSLANNRDELAKMFEAGDSVHNRPWFAAAEAQQSGFMDIDESEMGEGERDEEIGRPDFEATRPFERNESATSFIRREVVADYDPIELRLGDWVELLADTRWLRAQLTWISPQNTLFMFTSEGGRSHSMTSRVLQHLLKLELVKVVSQQGVLDGALNSVARTAIRNSVDGSPVLE
jgi:hypothetical protein